MKTIFRALFEDIISAKLTSYSSQQTYNLRPSSPLETSCIRNSDLLFTHAGYFHYKSRKVSQLFLIRCLLPAEFRQNDQWLLIQYSTLAFTLTPLVTEKMPLRYWVSNMQLWFSLESDIYISNLAVRQAAGQAAFTPQMSVSESRFFISRAASSALG
jgi:hypothetical protein